MHIFKKFSSYKLFLLFFLFKLVIFLYFVITTSKSILPRSKKNVLIDISSTNEDFISGLFNYQKKFSKYKLLAVQVSLKKLNENWSVYLVKEENTDENNFNEIKLELSQMNHKFYFRPSNTNFSQMNSLGFILQQFDENDFVVLKLDALDESNLNVLFEMIKLNQLNLIDKIYINYKFDYKHKDFLSQMFKYLKITELVLN